VNPAEILEPARLDEPIALGSIKADDVAARSARDGEPAFLARRRSEAWAFAEATPFPGRLEELWRRTDLSGAGWDKILVDRATAPSVDALADLPAPIKEEIGPASERSALVVLVDSGVVYREVDEELTRRNVTVMSLAEMAKRQPALLELLLGGTVRYGESRFTAIQAALASGGAIVYVPRGVEIERPIRIMIAREASGYGTFPHVLVALEPQSKATVIEEYFSPGDSGAGVNVGVTEVTVGEGADLHMATLQRWGSTVVHVGTERVRVARNGRFHWTFAGLGGKVTKIDMEMHLEGEGAEARFSGCYFGDGTQHFDFHSFQNHLKGHTTSDLLFKGALRGKARTVYQGLIKVHKDAQRSDAYQANRNLILSDKARADSIPSLEIEANDVRCTHGATVGQIDEEQRFYLMSRGLSRHESERLILHGFFEPVLERIPAASLRAIVTEAVERKAAIGA
jgi:Fe-S cluster assembly protein SufD